MLQLGRAEQRRGEDVAQERAAQQLGGAAQDRLAEAVDVEDPAVAVGGDEPALDAVDDHLVEAAQVGDLERHREIVGRHQRLGRGGRQR